MYARIEIALMKISLISLLMNGFYTEVVKRIEPEDTFAGTLYYSTFESTTQRWPKVRGLPSLSNNSN